VLDGHAEPSIVRKTITNEEMGRVLWQFCCNLAEDFRTKLRPKFHEQGFLRSPADDTAFMLEAKKGSNQNGT